MSFVNIESATRVADALADLCDHPDAFRALLDDSTSPLVDAVLAAAAADGLGRLGQACDQLDEALRQAGQWPGLYRATPRGSEPRMLGTTVTPVVKVFLCPGRQCSRHWFPPTDEATTPPRCAVSGTGLRERIL